MRIRFPFSYDKAVESMAYVVERLVSVDKAKLMKLLYIADRDHFLEYGWPITGDRLCALPLGPVPSNCLSILNGDFWPDKPDEFTVFHLDDNKVYLRGRPPSNLLEESEKRTLDAVLQVHGSKGTWELVRETHGYPEYRAVYRENTSTTIPFEVILEHSGKESHFRHDRPVVSHASVGKMLNPFDESDADL